MADLENKVLVSQARLDAFLLSIEKISPKVQEIIDVAARVPSSIAVAQNYTLAEHGVQVVHNQQLVDLLPSLRAKMNAEMLKMPEYKNVA